MKKALIIAFSFIFLILIFEKEVILLSHYFRQDYIAENYCVNPETSCQGSCHLKKELKSADQKTKDPAIPDVSNLLDKVFISGVSYSLQIVILPLKTGRIFHSLRNLAGFSGSVFHPPQV